MTKFLSLFFLFAVAGCSAQPKQGFVVDWQNLCGYPVEIGASNFTNLDGNGSRKQELAAGQSMLVLSIVSFNTSLQQSIPETYSLDIQANGRTRHMGKAELIGMLQQTQETPQTGNAIRHWKLADATVCP